MAERDPSELDLAAAFRAYLEEAPTQVRPTELARHFATAYPHRGGTRTDRWRLRLTPSVVWLLLVVGLLLAMVAGVLLVGSQPVRKLRAVVPPVGPVYECPPGSTPDEPGPVDQARPPSSNVSIAFDRAFGKIVLVGGPDGGGWVETWTFDVCTNTWTQMHPASEPVFGFKEMLAYDAAARRTISAYPGGGWTYDLASDAWTKIVSGTWTARPPTVYVPGRGRLVYDSGAARVVALQLGSPRLMLSLASGADVWEPVDQDQDVWPDPVGNLEPLLAYDGSVDRLVSYYRGEVRLFDLLTGTWSPPGSTSPPFRYGGGFLPSFGGEIAYDEAAQRTVLFSMGYAIAYDAAADRWETLYGPASDDGPASGGCGVRPECRHSHSMVYDPVNERLVVYGGHVHTGAVDPGWWGPSDDVLAFDTRTREWTVLLEASEGQQQP